MIIFLHGSDAYRLRQARLNIIEEYRRKYSSGVNLFYFDLSEDVNLKKLPGILKSSSFFNEHKLVVVWGAFARKTTADLAADLVNKYNIASISDITFLFAEPSPEKDLVTKGASLFRLLSDKNNVIRVFDPLESHNLREWVKKETTLRKCSISRDALEKLIDTSGNDSWALINEIEKLTCYKNGGEIVAEDISQLVTSDEEVNIFDLVDAIGSRNSKKAIELLYLNLASGRDSYLIFSLIVGQLRNLITLKNLAERNENQVSIAKKTGLHPFVIKKVMSQVQKFKNEELRDKYARLQELDIYSKEGRIRLEDGLYGLVV